ANPRNHTPARIGHWAVNQKITEINKCGERQKSQPVTARDNEIQKFGIVFAAELGVVRHMTRGIVIGLPTRQPAQIARERLADSTQTACSSKDDVVSRAFM